MGEYKKETGENILAVGIKFPTEKIYFPLKLTSVYGEKTIPITLYVNGYVTPNLYNGINSSTKTVYYANDEGLKYTKIKIKTPSKSFTQDLWIDDKVSGDITAADLINSNATAFMIILFIFYSCFSSLIAGVIVFKREVSLKRLIAIGLFNLFTFVGFLLASKYLIKTKENSQSDETEGENVDKPAQRKKKWLKYIALSLVGFFFLVLLSSILYFSYSLSSSSDPLVSLIIRTILFITVLIVGSGFTLLFFFGILIVPLLILYLLKSKEKTSRYAITFSILFLAITILSNWLLVSIFPMEVRGGGMVVTPGWTKLQPLAQTAIYDSTVQDFTATFNNVLGTSIKIKNVTATEIISDTECASTIEGDPVGNQIISAGDTLEIYAACRDANKYRGDTYDMVINITYDAVTGGFTNEHRETGHVRGSVE